MSLKKKAEGLGIAFAEFLVSAVEAISGAAPAKTQTAAEKKKAAAAAKKAAAANKTEEKGDGAPSLDDVMAALRKHAVDHSRESAEKKLAEFGAEKCSQVPEDKRAEFIAALAGGAAEAPPETEGGGIFG